MLWKPQKMAMTEEWHEDTKIQDWKALCFRGSICSSQYFLWQQNKMAWYSVSLGQYVIVQICHTMLKFSCWTPATTLSSLIENCWKALHLEDDTEWQPRREKEGVSWQKTDTVHYHQAASQRSWISWIQPAGCIIAILRAMLSGKKYVCWSVWVSLYHRGVSLKSEVKRPIHLV